MIDPERLDRIEAPEEAERRAVKRLLLARTLAALDEDKLLGYRPYGHPDTLYPDGIRARRPWSNKPWQSDFHAAGARFKERCTICANGVGKSMAASAETAIHVTGLYPDWWTGYRFDKPVKAWIGSIDADMQREGPQLLLLGAIGARRNAETIEDPGLWPGFISRGRFVGEPSIRQAGVGGIVDQAMVAHISGGTSVITFKTYQQGWRSWQGGAPNLIQFDEEPDENDSKQRGIFAEMQTRVFRSAGILYGALTPLLGETPLISHFVDGRTPGVWSIGATWDDAQHLEEADKARLRKSYPQHQVDARTRGVTLMGEGRIYLTPEDRIACDPFEIPRYFARIVGLDFGYGEDHPTAAVWLAWDRDQDTVYLTDCYRQTQQLIAVNAASLRRRGAWMPVAWPHDGLQSDPKAGENLRDLYAAEGVNMLPQSARLKVDRGGAQPTESIISAQQTRMSEGRFRVFRSCGPWFEEYRGYHRKDGKIVRRRDDLMAATHYAMMDLRYASTEPVQRRERFPAAAVRMVV